jgi:hypothetical protein
MTAKLRHTLTYVIITVVLALNGVIYLYFGQSVAAYFFGTKFVMDHLFNVFQFIQSLWVENPIMGLVIWIIWLILAKIFRWPLKKREIWITLINIFAITILVTILSFIASIILLGSNLTVL